MRFRKSLAFLCLAAMPMLSQASFEMGLILQGSKIHRWDPETNVYLGGINLLSGGSSMIAYRSTNEAYVLSSSWVYKYNYNTGEYRGRVAIESGAQSISKGMNDGEFLIGYASGVKRHNVSNGTAIGVPLAWSGGGFSYGQGALAMRNTGVYYLLAERTTYVEDFDYLIGVNSSSAWVGNFRNENFHGGTNTSIRPGDVSGSLVGFLTSATGSPGISTEFARRSSSDTLDYVFDNLSYGTSRKSYMQFGHAESVIYLLGAPTDYYYVRSTYDGGSNQLLVPGLASGVEVQGFSMILAPEPTTMVGLVAAGLALRRRRNSK